MTVRSAFLLSVLLFCGCATFHRHDWSPGQPGLHVVSGVPFVRQQTRDDCGPAALASLLAQRGTNLPLARIKAEVHNPLLRGSLLPDMENFARSQGLAPRSGRGDMEFLRRQIDAGRPVLIPVQMGFWVITRPHYLVVFGYDGNGFLAHAGVEENVFMAAGELGERWARMNSLYLFLE